MQNIKVNKEELLKVLEANKATHVAEYQEAIVGYRIALKKAFKKSVSRLKKTTDKELPGFNFSAEFTGLPRPQDHSREYDIAIRMLGAEIAEQIDLTEDEFRQYYFDEWSWSASAKMSNSTYSTSNFKR